MNDLIRMRKWGDITFGIPTDMEALHKPWGYYEFLGIPRDADPEQIKTAYKRFARDIRPDLGKNKDLFIHVKKAVDILLDTGGELGEEHSRRKQYDFIQTMNEVFNGFITYQEGRSQTFAEIMLIQLEAKREIAEQELAISKIRPDFLELKRKLKRARSDESKAKIVQDLKKMILEAQGLGPKHIEEVDAMFAERQKRHDEDIQKFFESFRSKPSTYASKVLDLFYVGAQETPFALGVEFGTWQSNIRFPLLSLQDGKNVLRIITRDDCYFAGFNQVHFKAPKAYVTITDPHLQGIFHIMHGEVTLRYNASSYGEVIRVRAPLVRAKQGFANRDDLFIPQRFATQNWWRKKTALDITVAEGTITLDLQTQQISQRYPSYSGIDIQSLITDNKIISNKDKYSSNNIDSLETLLYKDK